MPKTLHPAAPAGKPEKPYPEFPLFAHAAGVWAKKIRGKLHYFGPWSDPQAALDLYLEQKDDLHAGRKPRKAGTPEGLEVREVVNAFLTHKGNQRDTGELRSSSFASYYRSCAKVVDYFGARRLVVDLRPEDFAGLRSEMAKTLGLRELGKRIQEVRSLFKYGYDSGMMDRPIRFGPEFRRPSQKVMRRAKAGSPRSMLTAEEIRTLIGATDSPQLKAMILLGVNAGFGQTDCATLPLSAVDLDNGVHVHARPKTGIPRRCPLWPETVEAIRAALNVRPEAQDEADAELVFITRYGRRWVRFWIPEGKTHGISVDSIGLQFGKLLTAQGMKRPRMAFYTLRHVFRTVADEVNDRPATDIVMGHDDVQDMRSHYVHHVGDDRLRAVTDHVHAWLWPKPKRKKATK